MTLTLYMHPVSTVSRPVRLFIAEKGLPVEERVVDLMSGEHKGADYAAINPSGQVPALVEGDFRLTESSAILKYLAARFEAPEYPTELKARARVDQVMDWFNTQFYRDFGYGLLYPQLFPHHKRPSDDQQAGVIEWGKTRSRQWLEVLDRHIIGDGDWTAGAAITIADYFGAGLVTAGELIACRFEAYPNVRRWLSRMKALPHWAEVNAAHEGFVAAMAERQFEAI